jgi:hypothetical protein
MSQKINILCIKFKIIYNNAANTVVCEGWHLHMENTCIVASFNKEVRVGTVNKRRENQRGNQEWTIQKHWQHWVHKTQDENRKK